jgi:hypothetical protein
MKKMLLLLLFLPASAVFGNNETDSLLNVLDLTIKERLLYTTIKEHRIDNLKKHLHHASSDEEKYNLLGNLLQEYRSYQMDSALRITNERIAIAEKQQTKATIITAQMNLSEIMSVMGMYSEAFDMLKKLDRKAFDKGQLIYYYHIHHSIYSLMENYSVFEEERAQYQKLLHQYKDSILHSIPPEDMGYAMVKSNQLLNMGMYQEALAVAQECYRSFGNDDRTVAMIAYVLSDIYEHTGETLLEKKYLAISSIYDLRAGTKEYIALRKLAILLYEENNIDRAYNYLKCSMEDALFCNARFRFYEISQVLPIINATYDLEMKDKRNRLLSLLLVISVLSCVLAGALLYIYKQLKTLSKVRKSLKEINENLKSMNENLNTVNNKLSEANHVKEEYIGYLFNMCSSYINKLEDFRVKVNRKLKTGQTDDLYKITGSSSLIADEMKEFNKNFDTVFLSLYPNFIPEFNSLLQDDEQIALKEGELLTPELRIFALVRLGINDSVKIASFLHYSVQTVYNYRLKIRNKAVVPKEDFPAAIGQIGQMEPYTQKFTS